MLGSEMQQGDDSVSAKGNCEAGGFVLWQKNPDLWCLELVVAGFKICAGSNGKVAWNQSSSQPNVAHRGPPRPLRRFFQVVDILIHTCIPELKAQLFSFSNALKWTALMYFLCTRARTM